MGTPEGRRQILAGLKEAGINLVASVPDINRASAHQSLVRR